MKNCLSPDAILSIGDALDWDVSEGLRHLQTCEDCRSQVEVLRLTRAAFTESEAVDAGVMRRISSAVGAAAQTERQRERVGLRWAQWIEALVAGVGGVIFLASSRVPIHGIATAVFAFALGATLMVCGRMLARSIPTFADENAHA